jgi:hypothetical protein
LKAVEKPNLELKLEPVRCGSGGRGTSAKKIRAHFCFFLAVRMTAAVAAATAAMQVQSTSSGPVIGRWWQTGRKGMETQMVATATS